MKNSWKENLFVQKSANKFSAIALDQVHEQLNIDV